ncbi:MAG: ATP-grasp domain-containing protein [Alphaproteobacteria bacterium]|jgi:acetyl/propionyl-CoA carboxylase alpha subunit|nr:ATP-grasp domain-containing protein [Alphaproteobacteria bacterium]
MIFSKLLIANRGEIAIRIARAAADLGIPTVAVHARDEARSLHVRTADAAVALAQEGPAAYLDVDGLVAAAREAGCDAVHPGYGFLSESAAFAAAVRAAGMTFVGPRPELLHLFGDKAQARALAERCGVPLMAGTAAATTLAEAQAFFAGLRPGQAMMIKAIAGGGGRGMRVVRAAEEIPAAFERCRSEAQGAFGNGALYVERFMPAARHIEIQVVGDGRDVVTLGERECTIQRRNQKLVEIAPSPTLPAAMRRQLSEAALQMARKVEYEGLGTFEFLVTQDGGDFAFIEVNPRLQVEHTVTEAVMGVDLVQAQLRIAAGARLAELGLDRAAPTPRGHAIQLRINMETVGPDGSTRPSGGTLAAFDKPSGPGVRVDSFGYTGYATSPRYDSLLAKLIVHAPDGSYLDAIRRTERALREFRIEGLATNIPLLQALLADDDFRRNAIHTRFLDERIADLVAAEPAPALFFREARGRTDDPLGVFGGASTLRAAAGPAPEGADGIPAPLQGTVIAVDIAVGDMVRRGQQLMVLEAMKMEHPVPAPAGGRVVRIDAAVGDTVLEGSLLIWLDPDAAGEAEAAAAAAIDLDLIRPDLAEVLDRRAALLDDRRPEAVARRRKTGQRTARENIADLCDAGSFVEFGGLALAAQRRRRSLDDLRAMSPADGMITGLGRVNGDLFADEQARCAVAAYDYTVFAGTQGVINHRKTDRLLAMADKWRMPLVVFAEGGGGRPGDEWPTPAGLDTTTFGRMGALAGLVPTVGLVSGRCFAGNAALLGSCDVVIAARNTNIGMGGPAMIEGGGLGVFRPEDIGPMDVQVPNGVVDVLVADEAEGVAAARKYLGYFQGRVDDWQCADQRILRHVVPENRLRAYDVREVIAGLADTGSVLELREAFGVGMITALVRIAGRPVGLIANNSRHLGGAIDADGADKAARFIRLCDAFGLPIVSLCDTPGMMVGPEVEKTAQVRHVSRMFVAASAATVPYFTIVLRKGYGLGALAMAAGSTHASFMTLAWPTGEFGAMGLEGGVKLAYRKEMAAIEDPAARKAWFDAKVAQAYEENKALSVASFLEIDDVIDPAETRDLILAGLRAVPAQRDRPRKAVDVW